MDRRTKIAEQLSDILPNRPATPPTVASSSQLIEQEATRIKTKQDAKELARIKFIEKQKLKRLKAKEAERQSIAEELGIDASTIPDGRSNAAIKAIAEQEKRVEMIEAIEAQTVQPLHPIEIAKISSDDGGRPRSFAGFQSNIKAAMQLQGTTRPEITKLLTQLNINLSVQLTKQDTANLLACLLTCNESQLTALMNNKKVPVAIKIVIKRLLEDMKLGNMDTIDRLWDKIFGKGAMQLNLPEEQQLQTGIIPNVPVSREAYILIRDTLIK